MYNPNGSEKWRYNTVVYANSARPAISSDGTIYITDYNYVYAITDSGTNATEKWKYDPGILYIATPGFTSATIDTDGTVYVASRGYGDDTGRLYAFIALPPVPSGCTSNVKYSGDTVTLQATPKDGTGPYNVVFRKYDKDIHPSRLGGSNPTSVQEDTLITRVYTLDDLDISSSAGTIDFSVYMEDSCPTGAKTCTETCTITIGCVAPICNFQVT